MPPAPPPTPPPAAAPAPRAPGIGLIGCGRIAQLFHLPVLAAQPHAPLRAVADADPDARAAAGRLAPDAAVHDDAQAVLDDPAVTAVVIATPPATHADLAARALTAGRHVYVEKPLSLTAADARRLCELASAGNGGAASPVARCGLNFRHHPAVVAARRRLTRHELGRVHAVRSLFTAAARTLPPWKRTLDRGGGVLADLAVHHFDLATHLLGRPLGRVGAVTVDGDAGEEVTAAVQAEYRGHDPHPPVLFTGTYAACVGRGENRLELFGERGHLVIDTTDARPRGPRTAPGRFARLAEAGRLARPGVLLRSPWGEPSFAAALNAFARAVAAGDPGADPHGADLPAAAAALDVVLAARRSAADAGRPVSVAGNAGG